MYGADQEMCTQSIGMSVCMYITFRNKENLFASSSGIIDIKCSQEFLMLTGPDLCLELNACLEQKMCTN